MWSGIDNIDLYGKISTDWRSKNRRINQWLWNPKNYFPICILIIRNRDLRYSVPGVRNRKGFFRIGAIPSVSVKQNRVCYEQCLIAACQNRPEAGFTVPKYLMHIFFRTSRQRSDHQLSNPLHLELPSLLPYFRAIMTQQQIDVFYKFTQEEGPRKGEKYGEERLFKSSLEARANQRYYIQCPDGMVLRIALMAGEVKKGIVGIMENLIRLPWWVISRMF